MNGPQPGPQVPPVDPGNPILQPGVPAMMATFPAQGPDGSPLVGLTIRTVDTTLTVTMPRDAALEWARLLRNQAQQSSGLIVANGSLPPVPPGAGLN